MKRRVWAAASAAMMAVKISPVPEREVPMRCVLRTREDLPASWQKLATY